MNMKRLSSLVLGLAMLVLTTKVTKAEEKFNPARDLERAVCMRVEAGGKAFSKGDIYTGVNCLKDAIINTALIPIRGGFALAGIEGEPIYDPNKTFSFPVTHHSTDWDKLGTDWDEFKKPENKLAALGGLALTPYFALAGLENSKPVFEQASKSFNNGYVPQAILQTVGGAISVTVEYAKAADWLSAMFVRAIVQ